MGCTVSASGVLSAMATLSTGVMLADGSVCGCSCCAHPMSIAVQTITAIHILAIFFIFHSFISIFNRKESYALLRTILCALTLLFLTIRFYSITPDTTPEPTVLPPSRIANRSPSSIAIGVISLISISMLSPGITISVPLGSSITPVTSVVLK